jgi:4-hydroxybenzoate-CoA ligase
VLLIDQSLLSIIQAMRPKLNFLKHVVAVGGGADVMTISFDAWVADQSENLETAPTTPDDACFWLYSYGSTGRPK